MQFKVLLIMKDAKKHLESLSEIKNLMERSTKFISLSGLSGVFAGIFALGGAAMAYVRMNNYNYSSSLFREPVQNRFIHQLTLELIGIAILVLVLSVLVGIFLTRRESKKNDQNIWDKNSQLLLINLLIPLVAGGIFCLTLIYHGLFYMVAPCTLLFYGLALVNASKYTLDDVKYLGFLEILLGLINAFFVGKGLFFWAIGFGILHIVYGTVMHFKYNRKTV